MPGFFKDKRSINVFMIALAIFAGYSFIALKLNAFELPRLKSSDLYFKIAKAIREKPSALNDIVVVGIDDESLDKVKEQLPWSRRRLAELIDKIDFCNPKATAMNIVLFGEGPDIEGNNTLKDSITKARRPVILSSYFGTTQQKLTPHKPFLDVAAGCGFL
ncbi:MAG: CHASE2 domain-containing protein, partial [Candidatus Omnitrophica bacterium]|nr:CHASE2 domain-containing protein [Candidatus Omnitrophota bacterium]